MDTANTTDAFAERIRAMTEQLRSQLSAAEPGEIPSAAEMLEELFRQGQELGLTDKEIAQQLISPVAELIRPGLNR
jgi:uncharacterized membrane protein